MLSRLISSHLLWVRRPPSGGAAYPLDTFAPQGLHLEWSKLRKGKLRLARRQLETWSFPAFCKRLEGVIGLQSPNGRYR